MNKIEEIFKSWKIAYNPNDLQTQLATKRLEICNDCDSKKDSPYIHCGECGCILSKKIYTPVIGGCPRGKWVAVEMAHENLKNKQRYDNLK